MKPATFGIVHLENLLLKKEAQKGKSSRLENVQDFGKQKKYPPKKIPCKSWRDVSVTSSALEGHTGTEAPVTGKVKGAVSELALSGVTRSWKTFAFHRREAVTPLLGLSNKVWDGFSMFSLDKAKLVRIQPFTHQRC